METLSTNTEQLIKDTAKKVFFVQGKLHATTQDIADEAGINRASIHYYYRSRKQLFDTVFQEALVEMRTKLFAIPEDDTSFRERTEKFIDTFMQKSLEHPYLEVFIITEFNSNIFTRMRMLSPIDHQTRMTHLKAEIGKEVAAGTMKPITPEHFVITIMSLCSFPFLGKSILENIFDLDNEAYTALIHERKQVILKLLFLDA